MRFAHAADLHIDSPLRGLEHYPGAPVERVRLATRAALENLVRLCVTERVDFLVIAGDLFDYDWRDFNTALFVVKQFQLLDQAEIPVFLIRGNHDSREEMSRRVPWPRNVTLFDHVEPQTVELKKLGVAIHGLSFPKREVKENLVPRYPPPRRGLFNLGLLHTNATGSALHDPYAPCSVDELVLKGYDYWALGHLHEFDVLHEWPHVVYSGNTQGRHVRETGAKGCALVSVHDGEITGCEFRPTDVLRWFRAAIELDADDGPDELIDRVRTRLQAIAEEADGRFAAVRIEVSGRCRAHGKLVHDLARQELITELRSLPGEAGGELWVEKIKLETGPPLDRDALRLGQDLVGDLLRSVDALLADPAELGKLSELVRPLAAKAAAELDEGEVGFSNLGQLGKWVKEAETDLLTRLTEGLS